MPLNALHHVTVKTADLEATRDFYRDILGLEVGFRPDLDFPGYWLYCGDIPVVHLVPEGSAIGGGPSPESELAPNLLHVHRAALVGEGRIPRDHEKRGIS